MHTSNLPLALLSAVLPAAAKRDVRYYINGVRIESDAGTARSVATDGHILLTAHARTSAWGGPDVTLPRALVEAAIKAAGTRIDNFDMTVTAQAEGKPPLVTLQVGPSTFTEPAIDGRFPDWRAVVPVVGAERSTTVMNVDVMEQAVKAAKAIKKAMGGKFAGIEIVSVSPERSSVFRLHGKAEWPVQIGGVMMPMRGTLDADPTDPLAYCLPSRCAPEAEKLAA